LIPANHFAFNVENEFNAVVVEALFSDKQLFLGKGAGSHPTASAVLSDISALQFDYAYEYKKSKTDDVLTFESEYSVKVYLSATSQEKLDQVEFIETLETYSGPSHSYKIGIITYEEILERDWNNESDYFLAIIPDSVELTKSIEFKETESAGLIEELL
jgi:homoserine dehydrogenase